MRHEGKADQKRFALVSAVYNVADYLPDFIEAIEAQTFDLKQVEVIMVDDGSKDRSLVILSEWRDRRPELVTVIHQDNGGQGSARNNGMTHATSEWITFADPDDFLDVDYLATVDRLISETPNASMVATNRILFYEDQRGKSDTHPLRWMFKPDNQVTDISQSPGHFFGSAPAAFFRRAKLESFGLTFDERVRPNFEDGAFCCEYLFRVDPVIIFAKDARYYYRKRATGASSLQQSTRDVRRYLDVPRYGYLRVLQDAKELLGHVPEWLQNFVLYELSFYFSAEQRASGSATAAVGAVADEFLDLLSQIWRFLDPDVIAAFNQVRVPPQTRDFWMHGFEGRDWHSPVLIDRFDTSQGLVRTRIRYLGTEPEFTYYADGVRIDPAFAKTHVFELFGRALVREKIAWVPIQASMRVAVDGQTCAIEFDDTQPDRREVTRGQIKTAMSEDVWSRLSERPLMTLDPRAKFWAPRGGSLPWMLAKLGRHRHATTWMIMDRTFAADDNGERLFEYLVEKRSDINAYFCVEGGTPTYRRLKHGPYGKRVIAYGGARWRRLMMQCTHMISSHCSPEQMNPVALRRLRSPDWRFVFLQHGVIKDDLSRWLNTKDIALFVTSTQGEYDSIAGDGPYVFTGKETKLTGLPRFDRLHRLGEAVPVEERNILMLAPTWREWLTMPMLFGEQRRELMDGFMQSDFMRQWQRLLASPRLAELAADYNMRLVFLPHPNLRDLVHEIELPPQIEIHSIESEDVQQLFARTGLLVTDYSSMAFNSGFLGRGCVYFQFDEDRFNSGEHTARAGYFDYRRDGFGPVATDLEGALDAIEGALAFAPGAAPEYSARMNKTFTLRDDKACERLVAEIERL